MNFGLQFRKRQLSNLLLDPLLQTKIGLYCIALSLIFALLVGFILYENLGSIYDMFFELTNNNVKLHEVVTTYLQNIQAWVYVSLGGYILGTIAISIIFTHNLVGPTIAFSRHLDAIKNSDFKYRTKLRKGDAFQEVAARLNEISELLDNKNVKL